MIRVCRSLREEKLQARLILQVHDELLVESPREESARVAVILQREMEGAVSLPVDLKVEVGSGRTWGEAH